MSFIVITINSLSIVSPFLVQLLYVLCAFIADIYIILEMWANAQRDGRPAEYMWRRLFNAAKFGRRPLLECSAVTLPTRETR